MAGNSDLYVGALAEVVGNRTLIDRIKTQKHVGSAGMAPRWFMKNLIRTIFAEGCAFSAFTDVIIL